MGLAHGSRDGPGAAESGGEAGGRDRDTPRRRVPHVLSPPGRAHAVVDDGVRHHRE